MFGKWFGKKRSAGEKATENAGVAAATESGAERASEPVPAPAEAVPPDAQPDASAETHAETHIEEQPLSEVGDSSGAVAGTPDAESNSNPGGLRGMWESARRLAMTPVDPWFGKMAAGLNRTRAHLVGHVANLFRSHGKIDADFWDELEGILLTADVGVAATERIMGDFQARVKEKRLSDPDEMLAELKAVIGGILCPADDDAASRKLNIQKGRVNVVLMVGVNGTGKTTSTAKMASYYKSQGYKVLLAAADTFRAAAIDQLQVWADRVGVDLIRHQEGSDPASVVFDAIVAAKARQADIVFIDTAGRLHNKANLMEELRKIRRVAGRDLEGSPHEVLLVLDATTGQNALEQAKVFNQVTELTGLIMCKLDGTGKGGVVIAIAEEFKLPVKFIGVGEAVDDLREFVPEQYLEALFADPGAYDKVCGAEAKPEAGAAATPQP